MCSCLQMSISQHRAESSRPDPPRGARERKPLERHSALLSPRQHSGFFVAVVLFIIIITTQ
ncbi:hypothetical protein CRUP_026681 [Coryphaenoides rupestris]|nr:hypothetical protein CRUP_026681 [Coryphaenoides rupestris]